MFVSKPISAVVPLLILGVFALPGCDRTSPVSYSKDVRPIIDEHCMKCHKAGGEGEEKSGLNMETYADLMKGTKFGPMIVPGDAFGSNLIVLIEGRADPSIHMPRDEHGPLSEPEIATIKNWIEQGALEN